MITRKLIARIHCMPVEVTIMEEMQKEMMPPEEQKGYVPRPEWQIWGARIGLVLFILFVIYQIFEIARGGL